MLKATPVFKILIAVITITTTASLSYFTGRNHGRYWSLHHEKGDGLSDLTNFNKLLQAKQINPQQKTEKKMPSVFKQPTQYIGLDFDQKVPPCSCPLDSDTWKFDCGLYDPQISFDLAPFHGFNFTAPFFDTAFDMNTANLPPTYHFSIKDKVITMKGRQPYSAYHQQMLNMFDTANKMIGLPNVEFVMHLWDHTKVPRQDPVPTFTGTCKTTSSNDILLPYSYTWNKELDVEWHDKNCPKFSERTDKLFWRGGCTGPTIGFYKHVKPFYLRNRISLLSDQHPDLLDAGLTSDCTEGEPKIQSRSFVGEKDFCKYKYLLLLDGNTVSGRSQNLFRSGSVIFKPESPFYEHYYVGLKPYVHYIPVKEHLQDLVEQVRWANNNPDKVNEIAHNAKEFAKNHLNRKSVSCYIWRLLTRYAEQMAFTPRLLDPL
ncbi:hypothetical protein AKO1_014743 [Acrasis kona]|uniref:Glycosyl transferase CAP10 domain-containing protein n=1 Tax=Acrasis kona TaxID=1008807 RepID=A0AAW2Z3E1_9EUKA